MKESKQERSNSSLMMRPMASVGNREVRNKSKRLLCQTSGGNEVRNNKRLSDAIMQGVGSLGRVEEGVGKLWEGEGEGDSHDH